MLFKSLSVCYLIESHVVLWIVQKEQKELEEFELWEKLAQDASYTSQSSATRGRLLRGSTVAQRVQSQPCLVQEPHCGGARHHGDGASTGDSEVDTRDSECVSDGGSGGGRERRRKLAKLSREPFRVDQSVEVPYLEAGEVDSGESQLLSDLDSTLVAPGDTTPHTGPAFEFDDKEAWQSFSTGTPRGKVKGTGAVTGSSTGSSPRPLDSSTHTEGVEEGQDGEREVVGPGSRAESLESVCSTSMGVPLYSSTPPVKMAVVCGDTAVGEQRRVQEAVNAHSGGPHHEEEALADGQCKSGISAQLTSTQPSTACLTLVNQSQFQGGVQGQTEAKLLQEDHPPTASALMAKLFPGLKKQLAAPAKGQRDSVGTHTCAHCIMSCGWWDAWGDLTEVCV